MLQGWTLLGEVCPQCIDVCTSAPHEIHETPNYRFYDVFYGIGSGLLTFGCVLNLNLVLLYRFHWCVDKVSPSVSVADQALQTPGDRFLPPSPLAMLWSHLRL
jgi:hypothetical protein